MVANLHNNKQKKKIQLIANFIDVLWEFVFFLWLRYVPAAANGVHWRLGNFCVCGKLLLALENHLVTLNEFWYGMIVLQGIC